jgi:hypothetical protein
MRLDRQCFAATLAQALLASDNPARSREIVERAMATPIDARGMTMVSFLAGLSKPTLH